MSHILGYARVSTDDQDLAGQRKRLASAGAFRVFEDVISGKRIIGRAGKTPLHKSRHTHHAGWLLPTMFAATGDHADPINRHSRDRLFIARPDQHSSVPDAPPKYSTGSLLRIRVVGGDEFRQ
jgi:hypothetical protein